MRNLKAMAVLAGILMLFVMPALAAQSIVDSVAVVTDHSGSARVYAAGAWKNVEINMPLYEGDTVKTASDSALEVTFDDATIVKLGDNTELTLTELKRQGEVATTIFNLLKGKFMAIVDHLTNPDSRFEVHTKMAIAAVKGTELAVEADDNNTNLGVYTGSVEFTGPGGGSISGKYKVIVDKGNESGCGGSGVPGAPSFIRYMGKFEKEFGNLRETVKIVRELKAQGGDSVYKWRIKKKLEKEGKVVGESDTEGTIGGTNKNIGEVKEKIQKALRAKLQKEMMNEKSHAYKDLRFIGEAMNADLHLGKTMTDLHGNRVRLEEFIYRPNDKQVDMLSLTLRDKDRLDYIRISNLFINPIPQHPTWAQWKSMWQKDWLWTAPENYLTEQSIKLSNVSDWVFMATSYQPSLFTQGGAVPYYWKLLKQQDMLALGTGDIAGDMTVDNFTSINPVTANLNNKLVKEQVLYGFRPVGVPNTLIPSDTSGNQSQYRGPLDKTYQDTAGSAPKTAYQNYLASASNYGVQPVSSVGFASYTQDTTIADYAVNGDIAMKHTRNYNDGTNLVLNLYLISDYGLIQAMPDFATLQGWAKAADIIFNSNVEIIARSNVFADKVNGIDVVSKLLWYLVLNPKNTANATNPESTAISNF